MTNLVAIAVTVLAINNSELKTNVTESAYDPGSRLGGLIVPNSIYYNNYGQLQLQPAPPVEKWVTTVVTKEDELNFVWMDQTNIVRHSQVVSSNTVHLRIKQDWETVK